MIDPDSMTQTFDQMAEKVQNGGVLFSIFNYSGSLSYNTDEHTSKGKMMYCMKPEQASPIVYGMNTQGGESVWSIGANCEYPEKCMELINYFATPEGRMTLQYGPKGLCWDYDDQGNTIFTEFGRKCRADENTTMGNGHKVSTMAACRSTIRHGLLMQKTQTPTEKLTTASTGRAIWKKRRAILSRIGAITIRPILSMLTLKKVNTRFLREPALA